MRTEHPEQLGDQALPHTLSFSTTGEIATEKASLGTWVYYLRGGLTGESNWFSYSLQCAQYSFFFPPVMSWNFSSVLLCSDKDPLLWAPIAGDTPERIESPDAHTFLCTRVHSSVVYDSQKWKQLKCPLTHEWISNTRYLHTLGYHSVIKSTEVLTHAAVW